MGAFFDFCEKLLFFLIGLILVLIILFLCIGQIYFMLKDKKNKE